MWWRGGHARRGRCLGHVGVDGGGVEERDLDEVVAGLRGALARGAALGLGPTAGPDERVDTERVREGGRRGNALGRCRGGGREGARRSEGETTTRGRTRRPGRPRRPRGRERRGHHLSEPDEGRGGGGGERSVSSATPQRTRGAQGVSRNNRATSRVPAVTSTVHFFLRALHAPSPSHDVPPLRRSPAAHPPARPR